MVTRRTGGYAQGRRGNDTRSHSVAARDTARAAEA